MPRVNTYDCDGCGRPNTSRQSRYAHKKVCTGIKSIPQQLRDVQEQLKKLMANPADAVVPQPPPQPIEIPLAETWYQHLVEKYLCATHMTLPHCITDVTTDTAHAEIKRWTGFVKAIGQLMHYNALSPRPELHAYMFDKTCGAANVDHAAMVMGILKIKVFAFEFEQEMVHIIEYATKKRVFSSKHNL